MSQERRWQKVRISGGGPVEAFLRQAEPRCVSACARYIERDRQWDRGWSLAGPDGAVSALTLYLSRMLFPLFFGEKDVPLPRFMRRLFGNTPLHAIQGLREDAVYLEELIAPLGYESSSRIDYDLMSLDKAPLPRSLMAGPPGLVLRKPGGADAEGLFRLQEAYEKEEVIPPGGSFNAAVCRLSVERMLKQEQTLAAELGGRLVGKINISAASFTRYQLGGVYVHPNYRGLGIATRMTAALAGELAEKRGLTLFVKQSNTAAKKLYRRTGFETVGEYRITYY